MKLKINKVEIITSRTGIRHAWYLTIVKVDKENSCYWSHHDCSNYSDSQAKTMFEREHFQEVEELVRQQIINNSQLIINN